MANPEQLMQAGLAAYERGRLTMAAHVAWLVIPATAGCALATGEGELSCCLAALFFVVALYLRWRDRRGVEVVATALRVGGAALVAGLIVTSAAPSCGAVCCAVVGALAGVWVGARSVGRGLATRDWVLATALTAAAVSAGCARPGVFAIVAAVSMLVVVSALVRLATTAAHR